MSETGDTAVRLALLEDRFRRLEEELDQAKSEMGDDLKASLAKTQAEAAGAASKSSEAVETAEGAKGRVNRVFQWGSVIAVVLAGMFSFTWYDAPRRVLGTIDARVTEATDEYLASGDLFSDVVSDLALRLNADSDQVVIRTGRIETSAWQPEGGVGIKADVPLDLSGLSDIKYFATLEGVSGNWTSTGPSIYPRLDANGRWGDTFDDTGFSVFVFNDRPEQDLIDYIQTRKWAVSWMVVGMQVDD